MSNLYLTMMMWVLFLPIFESRLLLKTEPKPTGALRLQITQRGLTYVKDVVMEMLLSQLREEPIPDQSSSYNVPTLGEVSMQFSNIQIKQLQVMDSVAYFDKDTGVRLFIQDAHVLFSSNWKIKHLFGLDNGIVQANISELSLSVLLGLDVDYMGRPLLRSLSCSANIQDLQLMFFGSNSYFYNLVSQGFKNALISDLSQEECTGVGRYFPSHLLHAYAEDGQMQVEGRALISIKGLTCPVAEGGEQICAEVKKSVHNFSQNLRSTKFSAQIDPVAGIDYSLVSKPEIEENRCNLDFKGEFFLMEQRQRIPLVPTPIFLPNQSRSMVVIGVSDDLVNSAALVYFSGNMLQLKLTEKMIPKRSPIGLNTQSIGYVLPELRRWFPTMPMELHLAAREEPKLHFHPEGLDAIVLGQMEAFVVLPNSSLVPVFTLNIDCSFRAYILLEEVHSGNSFAKIGGSLALRDLRLSQVWSRIGELKLSPLESLLKLAGRLALAGSDKKLRAGKLLPDFYGARLVEPVVSMYEGYMLIKTDLHLSLPNSVP